MNKREKRLRDLRNKIARRERDREAGIKLLVKAVTELPGLRKQLDRLERGWAPKEPEPITDEMIRTELLPGLMAVERKPEPEDEDVPDFLVRTKDKDAEAAAKVKAEAEAEKKRKAAIRIEKMKVAQEHKQARLTGATRRLPLSGKAALAAIRAQD